MADDMIRVGQAAEMLGVTVETIRRWEGDGRLAVERSAGGQRLISLAEVTRLLGERRRTGAERPIVAGSARNRFPGIVTRIEKDRIAAVVEILAGPHRIVSLMTAEAVDEMGLEGRRRGGRRRQGDDGHRRDPVIPGVEGMKRLVTAVFVGIVVAACSGSTTSAVPTTAPAISAAPSTSSPSPAAAAELTIYGAASLKGALDKIKAAYESAVPGTTLTISTDSSAALETQIEQGAPADIFLSADTTNPKKLVDKGLTSGPAVAFAGNTLTVIVPTANQAGITTPADLAKPGVKVIAAGDAVPITKYAGELVANLAKQAGYPADFAAAYAANVVSKEDNVAAVVAKIETGDGDAAIVYVTDAKKSTKATTVPVPDDANVPADLCRESSSSRLPTQTLRGHS